MEFFYKYRQRFRLTAIVSALSFNFFMIYASWADDEAAWITTYIIAGIAIICGLVCHFTQNQPQNSEI